MSRPTKKLIETIIPLTEINDASAYGKMPCIKRALLTARVLRRELECDQVITVTPFDIFETLPAGSDFLTATPSNAIELIQKESYAS